MDVLITRIYDTLRFKHYFHIKLMLPDKSTLINNMINNINSGKSIAVNNLPECDVRYLQRTGYHCNNNPGICDLKILNNTSMKKTDITPSSNDDKPQSSSFELYSVTYTKVIENKEALNIHQITALLNNPNVKSINIKK